VKLHLGNVDNQRQNSQIKDITVSRKFRRKVPSRGLSGKKTFNKNQFSVMQVSVNKGADVENSIFSQQSTSKTNLTQRFRKGAFRTGNLSHRKGAKMTESINLVTSSKKRNTSGSKFSRINRFKTRSRMHNSVGGNSVGRRFENLNKKNTSRIIKRDTSEARSVFDSIQVGKLVNFL
jgi:hypothetical protein